jgi:hypothetical protein
MHQLGEDSRYSPDSCESLNSSAELSWEAQVRMNLAHVLSVRHIKCPTKLRRNHVTPLHPPPPRFGTGVPNLEVSANPAAPRFFTKKPSLKRRKGRYPWKQRAFARVLIGTAALSPAPGVTVSCAAHALNTQVRGIPQSRLDVMRRVKGEAHDVSVSLTQSASLSGSDRSALALGPVGPWFEPREQPYCY